MTIGPDRLAPSWPDGFGEFYRDHYVALVRTAYLIVQDAMDAESMVQDAMMAVAERWDTIDHHRAYCRTVVVNNARSHLRRQGRVRPAPLDHMLTEGYVDRPDELWDVLNTLDERRKVALVLRYYAGLDDDEIAATLGCRKPTVRTLIFRAIRDIRKQIDIQIEPRLEWRQGAIGE